MQLMVASAKTAARAEFGKLLNVALDRIEECPKARGRTQWLFRALKENHVRLVSAEQCRKYIKGVDIPDQAHLRIIAKRLHIPLSALQPAVESASDHRELGESNRRIGPRLSRWPFDDLYERFQKLYPKDQILIGDTVRKLIVGSATNEPRRQKKTVND